MEQDLNMMRMNYLFLKAIIKAGKNMEKEKDLTEKDFLYMKEDILMINLMEKEKNIILMANYILKENF